LIAAGRGAPFGTREDRPMREWVAVAWLDEGNWDRIAEEALAFVGGASSEGRRAP
jgi:hypothetical protein